VLPVSDFPRATRSPLLVLLLGLTMLSLAGCGAPTEVPQEEPVVHLKALAVFYGRYVASHRGQSPPSEAEFKKYVQSLSKTELEALGVTDVESLFVSPRDGQPYHVQYNIPLPPPGPDGAPVVAYEQTGEGGERYVATSLGDVQLMDEAKFQAIAPK
jgi:hypothetical protein